MADVGLPAPGLPGLSGNAGLFAGASPLRAALRGDLGRWLAAAERAAPGWVAGHAVASAAVFAALLLATGAVLARAHRHGPQGRTVSVLLPPEIERGGAEALWSTLAGLAQPGRRPGLRPPRVAFEYLLDADGVRIQLWAEAAVPAGLVERAVEAAWPGARATVAPARPPLGAAARDEACVGGQLRLARGQTLPIRTDQGADPLRAVLAAQAALGPGQRAVVQVAARPLGGSRRALPRRGGAGLGLPAGLLDAAQWLLPGGAPAGRGGASRGADRLTRVRQTATARAALGKELGVPHFAVCVRYAVAVPAAERAPRGGVPAVAAAGSAGQARAAAGIADALGAAFARYTGHNAFRRRRLARPARTLARRATRRGDVLSVAELAALAHLPEDTAIPVLPRAGARSVAPPPDVPGRGDTVRPIGVADSGDGRPVGLRVADGRRHLHILGATGAGKSELLARLTLDDVDAKRGLVNVDPKGDLIPDILARIPLHAAGRVVLLDAHTSDRPPCLNPLDQADRVRAAENLTAVFSRIYASSWGPRTEDILRSGLLTLAAGPAVPKLTDLPRLLDDDTFRARARRAVTDPVLRGFWQWYDGLTPASRALVVAPLMNKLRGLLLNPFVRDVLSAGPATVRMEDILDGGGICLVRLSQDRLGTDTAALLGSLVVAEVWQAATRRARLPQDARPDATLYVDEAHNFLNLPYPLDGMLAAARGFRLSIVIAHQHLGQLPRHMEEAVATNARNKIFFATSPGDAARLAPHVAPRLTAHDLSHLGAFHVAVRLVVDGAATAAFTARTEQLPPALPGHAQAVIAAANQAQARPGDARLADPFAS